MVSSDSFTSTPNALQAEIVALVSFEWSTFFIILFPSDSAERNIALCV